MSTTTDVFQYAIAEVKPDGWRIWRCPHCNAWDWALQGHKGQVRPGPYTCEECGGVFGIPKEGP